MSSSEQSPAADMIEGEVLWIEPVQWLMPAFPTGFPFRVDRFAGRDENGQVYARGLVLAPSTGAVVCELTLLLPLDQPRAVRRRSVVPTMPGFWAARAAPVDPPRSNVVRPYINQAPAGGNRPDYQSAADDHLNRRSVPANYHRVH